jgi:hypothetical protein
MTKAAEGRKPISLYDTTDTAARLASATRK